MRFKLQVYHLVLLLCWLCLPATPALSTSGQDSPTQPTTATVVQATLTAEEQSFLTANPVIRLGVNEDWTPYVIRRPSGELEGDCRTG